MRYAPITERLAGLGGAKWDVHVRARELAAQGRDVIELTIGEPDVPTPTELIDLTVGSLKAGRTSYSNGRGEPALLEALAEKYTRRSGRGIRTDQILCFPGTQTALYAVMMGLVGPGDDVIVGDPMYATYEGVIAASGAHAVPVPLRAKSDFHMAADDLSARVTPASRAILLNSPHNPSGAVLSAKALAQIGQIAVDHDLWLLCDEVYEELVFDNVAFASPLDFPDLAERVVVVSSISKSHAAPGFRSGWVVGPAEMTDRLLPLAETMLFGNQPFIADMTAAAVRQPSPVAAAMRQRLARRAGLLADRFADVAGIDVHRPDAGMFALLGVEASGMTSKGYALDLLERTGVAVMPGCSFGGGLAGWVRVALTVDDDRLARACERIADHAAGFAGGRAA